MLQCLIAHAESKDSDIREEIMYAMESFSDQRETIIPVLLQGLRDKEGYVRQTAYYALDVVKSKEAVILLLPALKDNNTFVRQRIATLFGRWGKTAEAAVPHLRALLNDPDPSVRIAATNALKRIG